MNRPLILSALLLALGLPAAASTPPPVAAVPPAAPAPASPLDQPVFQALQKYRAGDAAGALAILAPHQKEAAGQAPVLSLLGAIYVDAGRPKEGLDLLAPLAAKPDADAAVLYNAGRAALGSGKADDAIGYLKRSVALDSASPASRELGLLLARRGQVVEAYSNLRPWSIRSPRDAEARLTAASLALQLERPFEAEELLVGQPKSDPAIRLLLGKVAIQKGDGPAALALLEPLVAKHPPSMDLELRRTRAEAFLLADSPGEAVRQLRGKTGGVPSLALLLARGQRQTKDVAGALATLEPFAAKLPADAKSLGDPRPAAAIAVEYGQLLAASGRPADGLVYLEKATRLNPLSPEAFRAYGQALQGAGKGDQATPVLARAKELDEGRAQARKDAQAADQEYREAFAAFQSANAAAAKPGKPAEPMSPEMQEALRAMSSGDRAGALAAIRRRLAAVPGDLPAYAIEVRLLLGLGRLPEALAAAEAALRQAPQNADMVYQRGAVQMALKHSAEAERDFRRALELQPAHLASMNDLAVLLTTAGKKAEAEKLLRRVLDLNPRDANAAANLEQLRKETH